MLLKETHETDNSLCKNLDKLLRLVLGDLQLAFLQVDHNGKGPASPIDTFSSTWNRLHSLYKSNSAPATSKPARSSKRTKVSADSAPVPWPFPRPDAKKLSNKAVVVPIKGVDASYLTQIVLCGVPLGSRMHAAVVLLTEYFSRSEGPLYSAVRGQGFAYDCAVNFRRWSGHLVFTCHDATAPEKGIWKYIYLIMSLCF